MWFLVILTLVNSVLHQQKVQNVYRITLGVIQLGILDFLIGIGVLVMLIRGGSYRQMFPAIRTHPVVVWMLTSLFVGGLFGIAGGVINGSEQKYMLSSAREFFALPILILIGYRLLGTPRHVRVMSIVMLIAGVLTATALFWSFGEQAEEASLTGSLNVTRGIILPWNAEYAPLTALVLCFVILTRAPLWPIWLSLILGLYCFVAYASTLSRGGFLILLLGTASTTLLLPKGTRLRSFVRIVVYTPVLILALWGSLNLGDAVIGRGFATKVNKHVMTLLPGERTGSNEKAWDSRIGGIITELGIWIRNPLMGQGFGAGETAFLAGKVGPGASIKHNGWTSTLAETGVFGFLGVFLLISSLLLIGYRMVHDQTNPTYVLMGAVGFASGVIFLIRCSTTLSITSRSATEFALVCGMLLRAREMQETQVAMASQEHQVWDPYYDEQTGRLVPSYEPGGHHYGYN